MTDDNAVPQATEFSDAQPFSKGKMERVRGKKKDSSKPTNKTLDNGFMTVLTGPVLHTMTVQVIAQHLPFPLPGTETDSPAPTAFSRITPMVVSDLVSGSVIPISGKCSKMVFRLSFIL